MARDDTKKAVEEAAEDIRTKSKVNEAYFVGLLWSDPINSYGEYKDDIDSDEFVNDEWGFYYELGKRLYEAGIQKFDDISIHSMVKELGVKDQFNEYGGLETIDDAVEIVSENIDNINTYYNYIKKNSTLRELYKLVGDKVFLKNGNYNHKEMERSTLISYWHDQFNKLLTSEAGNYETKNLYVDPKEFIKEIKKSSEETLPYYDSKLLNGIAQGLPRGHITMLGGFGGSGKSSFAAAKFIMSCIKNNEKTIVVLNEEDANAFRQKIVLSLLFSEFGEAMDRKRFVNGLLTEEDEAKIEKAFEKMYELMEGNESLIKVIFMEKYIIKDLEKIIRFWANRGYINLLIDTHKPSDESKYDSRWETFVEDMKTIYSLTRREAGGLNLRTLVTIQLADSAITQKYLDFGAIGEGKKAKNEVSVMHMFRTVWDDEYEGGRRPIKCYTNHRLQNGEYIKKYFELKKDKTYYLLFTPKNRFGSTNDNGQAVLVLEPLFYANTFKEVGWCKISNDKSHR